MSITLAIDAMGGDHGVEVTVPAAIKSLKCCPNTNLILVGQEDVLRQALAKGKSYDFSRISIQNATEVVGMDEKPSLALRGKKDSSMRVAVNLVKEGKADACVSAGNTGALMATSRFVLKTLPGIDRPAIVYAIPTIKERNGVRQSVHILDLGANVDCTSEHLFQFAIMGSVLRKATMGQENPQIALLNIGEEELKGLDSIKQAAKLLNDCKAINYIGFVEGNDIFTGKADVIVCDGFIGNVALKTIEGMGSFVSKIVKKSISRSLLNHLCAILALPVFYRLKKTLDMRKYNGASFLGLKGIVIKSHGSADIPGYVTAIKVAVEEVEKDIPTKIHDEVETLMGAELDESDNSGNR